MTLPKSQKKSVEMPLLNVGDTDSSGNYIAKIWNQQFGRYSIYETGDGRIRYKVQNVDVKNDDRLTGLYMHVGDLFSHAPALRRKYNSSYSHAVALHLDGDVDASYESFKTLVEGMTRYLLRRGKIAFLLGGLTLMAFTLAAYLSTNYLALENIHAYRFSMAILLSSMGGFVSIATGLNKLKLEKQNSLWLHGVYGAIRVLIAAIFGVILVCLVDADIVFPFLKNPQNINGLALAAFMVGFSEKLFPNLLKSIEK
jgi:hypothetical protein